MQHMIEARPESVGVDPARLARIDAWREQQVQSGRLAGLATLMLRRGRVIHAGCTGLADRARNRPWNADTICRIYSMTKPLTSLAVLMLYEEGRFQLDDPIARFLPAFGAMRVFVGGSFGAMQTEPALRDITFRDLLTHTAGLTYGFMDSSPVDALYRARGLDFQTSDKTLAELVDLAASLPLLAQPGSAWNYSIATDVLGHLVAVISGQSFADFLHTRILGPLGMRDTAFHVPDAKAERFAALYMRTADENLLLIDDAESGIFRKERAIASGGGGLVSTMGDYLRFCRMMLNGGSLDGVRFLGRKTLELMTANHLNGDMAAMGQPRFSESPYTGIGFGLGFSVMLDPARAQILGSPGEYAWGGAASTAFWIDPQEELAVILLTQLLPSSTWPLRRELRVLTYQTLE